MFSVTNKFYISNKSPPFFLPKILNEDYDLGRDLGLEDYDYYK